MRIESDHQRENALILYEILFIDSLRKCMEIGLDNLYVVNLYEHLLY